MKRFFAPETNRILGTCKAQEGRQNDPPPATLAASPDFCVLSHPRASLPDSSLPAGPRKKLFDLGGFPLDTPAARWHTRPVGIFAPAADRRAAAIWRSGK